MSIFGLSIGFEAIIFIFIGIVIALGLGQLNQQFSGWMRSAPGCIVVVGVILVFVFLAYYFLF
jgi:hypothetical protein